MVEACGVNGLCFFGRPLDGFWGWQLNGGEAALDFVKRVLGFLRV